MVLPLLQRTLWQMCVILEQLRSTQMITGSTFPPRPRGAWKDDKSKDSTCCTCKVDCDDDCCADLGFLLMREARSLLCVFPASQPIPARRGPPPIKDAMRTWTNGARWAEESNAARQARTDALWLLPSRRLHFQRNQNEPTAHRTSRRLRRDATETAGYGACVSSQHSASRVDLACHQCRSMSFVPKISTSGSVYMPIVLVSWLVLAHEIMSYEEFRINFKISMNQTSVRHRAQTLEHTLTRETTFRYFSEDSNNDTLTTHSTSDKITRPPNHSLKSSHVIPEPSAETHSHRSPSHMLSHALFLWMLALSSLRRSHVSSVAVAVAEGRVPLCHPYELRSSSGESRSEATTSPMHLTSLMSRGRATFTSQRAAGPSSEQPQQHCYSRGQT